MVLFSSFSLFLFLIASVLVLPSSRSRPTSKTAIREARQCSIRASSNPGQKYVNYIFENREYQGWVEPVLEPNTLLERPPSVAFKK